MQEQFTIRIYNSKLASKINSLYKECDKFYSTKNPFLVACLEKGVDALERDLVGNRKIQNMDELYDEIKETSNKLNELLKISEDNAKEFVANNLVNQKLLSCNYNMLLGISEDTPRRRDFIEEGAYDDLPERFEDVLTEISKVYDK